MEEVEINIDKPTIKDELDSGWIEDFKNEDEIYKNFYKGIPETIKIILLYIDTNNSVISGKKLTMPLENGILKQDILTTGKILNILNTNQIDFEVIPEYDLVHYFDKITKLFIGTQALTNDNYLICDPGTSNIVSECHIHKIPIILFLKTLKFSHYPAADQNIRKNSFQDEYKGIEYSFSIHSNDIIDLGLISQIITEKGEVSKNNLTTMREKVMAEY